MKVTAKSKDCRLMVKVKTSFGEKIDDSELDRFIRANPRGFLKAKLTKRNTIEYIGPVGISLADRLERLITKRDFFFILEHIVMTAKCMRVNGFMPNYLRLNLQYIFINESTKELQFLYAPVSGKSDVSTFAELIETIVYQAKPAQEKDMDYISRFHYAFRSIAPFDIDAVERIIRREDKEVVAIINKHYIGQSGFITNKQRDYQKHYEQRQKELDSEDTMLMDSDVDETDLMDEEMDATDVMNEETEETSYMYDEPDETSYMGSDNDPYQVDETMNLWEKDDEPAEPEEEECTGLLMENTVSGNVTYPSLVHVRTGENISVNKTVFRIGKERNYVDYFVANNNAVSRSHADIICRASGCFVKDLNSKNHTYINNRMLEQNVETPIHDGDSLRLANEDFIFYMNSWSGGKSGCPGCGRSIQGAAAFCPYCGSRL